MSADILSAWQRFVDNVLRRQRFMDNFLEEADDIPGETCDEYWSRIGASTSDDDVVGAYERAYMFWSRVEVAEPQDVAQEPQDESHVAQEPQDEVGAEYEVAELGAEPQS